MDVQFITSVAVITPNPAVSRRLYLDALGLSLTAEADGYLHSEDIDGSKSFGVWPLAQAAQACFGTPDWPADRPVPQASIEFEVTDVDAVQVAADELKDKGFALLHRPAPSPGDKQSLGFSRPRARSSASRTRCRCISND
jgi:catechol 2,3-dioxygenase-like lactoylglutathione lyase family enzyme